MATNVSNFMLGRLRDHGVERIYGYPGDGINGILGAFHDDPGIDFVQTRHEEPFEEPPREHGAVHSSPAAVHKPRVVPSDADLQAAAQLLNECSKPAILIGQGAAGAADEVIQMADNLGCGVAKALNGRAALPDDLPFVTGSIGLLGTKPSEDMMSGCDGLLMVGS